MSERSAGLLDDLWEGRLEVLATNLATGGREHLEIASLARHIEADYGGRFLVELLQNGSDQARRAGLTASTMYIVRAPGIVAVTNEGAPFDDAGVRAITELGMSPKDAGFAIGNKGVGFKSVFEVSSAPEIISSVARGLPFTDSGYSFRFNADPFHEPKDAGRLEALADRILARRADLPDRIRARHEHRDPRAELMAQARRSASFRFPLPLSAEGLRTRLADLGLPDPAMRAGTLVVLPIRDDDKARRVAEVALDEVFLSGDKMLLFLPSVSKIALLDYDRGREAVFDKEDGSRRRVARRGRYHHLFVRTLRAARDSGAQTERSWLVVERTLGDDACSQTPENAAGERDLVRDAAQLLQHENWKNVCRAKVEVALPLPAVDALEGAALDPDGRLCISLPTLDPTGTPLWVDAPFHGTISRKGINFAEPYNELLLQEALSLTGDLIAAICEDPARERRRLAALSLQRTQQSPFVDRIYSAPDGLARGEIVLSANGQRFLRPAQLVLPSAPDLPVFELMAKAAGDVERFGFILPDGALLQRARSILDKFPGSSTASGADRQRYVRRPDGSRSLLEAAAYGLRASPQPGGFERFLTWVCDRFTPAELDDQVILPVGDRDLAARRDRVFLRPVPRSTARRDSTPARGASSAREAEESEPAELPADVRAALRFIDETVVPVRVGERDLSPLARSLAPDAGGGLVKRPRGVELLDEALAPRLQEAANSGDHDLALRLLETAVRWLAALPLKSRAEVHGDRLRVPVVDPAGEWRWTQPDAAVFGRGWLGGAREELLVRIYGDDEARLLVPWEDLAHRLATRRDAESPDAAFWHEQLHKLGVWSSPRILSAQTYTPPFRAYSYNALTVVDYTCPFPELYRLWRDWLDSLRMRSVPTRSGQEYDFDEVHWIEHLEHPERRAHVVEAMLRSPECYVERSTIILRRAYVERDPHRVAALWVHAIRAQDWPVVPTVQHGIVPVSRAFRLERDQAVQLAERHAFLPHPGSELAGADSLLSALNVPQLADASPRQLIGALHELAAAFPIQPERERAAHALAADLYRRLQAACHEDPAADLSAIKARPVPLERNRRLEAVRLTDKDCIYIADDPVRLRLLRAERILVLPLPGSTTAAALVASLRVALDSPGSVVLASEAPLDSGFQPDPASRRMPLLDALSEEFRDAQVRSDLASIVAYLGKQQQQPGGEVFSRAWKRLGATELVRGRFREDFPYDSLLEDEPGRSPRLLVRGDLRRGRLIEATWTAVGIAHRDVLAVYARALEEGVTAVERFFAERSVGLAERAEIEEVIGTGLGVWLQPLRPLLLVAWWRSHPNADIDQFLTTWGQGVASLRTLDAFTGLPGLSAWLQQHRNIELEALVTQALTDFGLTTTELVRAIGVLGSDLVFDGARRSWEHQRALLEASIMAVTARRARVDPAIARALIAALRGETIPPEVERQPRNDEQTRAALVARARVRLASLSPTTPIDAIEGLLADEGPRRPTPHGFVLPPDVSDREVNEFRDRHEDTRAADAAEVLTDLLAVATRLAARRGVPLDEGAVRSDPRVALLSGGYFANRFALLNALSEALDRLHPDIARLLRDVGAFRAPLARHDLAKRLAAELGPEQAPPMAPPPAPIEVAGVQIEADALPADLALGAAGRIGQRLIDAVQTSRGQIDLAALRDGSREVATARSTPARVTHRRRGRGTTHGEAREERDRIGLIGEIFAFELLRAILDDFDQASWCSENRNAYGFDAPGADAAGSDFEWVDRKGQLTGRDNEPRCMIEVKSSAGDTDGPFHLSINQWNVAQHCHQSGGREVYIILRVADVATIPRLAEVLIDPVQMELDKKIALSQSEMWVWVGGRANAG